MRVTKTGLFRKVIESKPSESIMLRGIKGTAIQITRGEDESFSIKIFRGEYCDPVWLLEDSGKTHTKTLNEVLGIICKVSNKPYSIIRDDLIVYRAMQVGQSHQHVPDEVVK